ncbi:MAG: cation transporter [Kaiparowitsia implicata GSE-PSE-MK54-09C]|jgi:Co/Zn/Cd efflux system component|nr:cation transporter [Kaiparowitsia implicata GSE-PSE-MK54-09C]
MNTTLRRTVLIVVLLNLAYFWVEFALALRTDSVSLFADGADFLEDASVNLLIFFALAWTATTRARVGMVLAGILLVPALALLWALWGKFTNPVPPEPFALSITGAGALVVYLFCAFLLARFRAHSGSLTRAAFLSARNDAMATLPSSAPGW